MFHTARHDCAMGRGWRGRTAAVAAVSLWCLAALAACSGASTTMVSEAGSPTPCVPGESPACAGPNGCQGYQVCRADGSGYDPCICGTPGDASPPPDGAQEEIGDSGF